MALHTINPSIARRYGVVRQYGDRRNRHWRRRRQRRLAAATARPGSLGPAPAAGLGTAATPLLGDRLLHRRRSVFRSFPADLRSAGGGDC